MNYRFLLGLMMTGISLAAVPGCSTSGSLFRDPARLVRDPGSLFGRPRVEKHVVRIVALWEASQGKGVDDKPARGFAGQILFFGPKGETGVRVHGHVNIYEYDEFDNASEEDLTPLHTFSFHPDTWDLHHTEGTLGHSYSCFIPYMRKHKEQVNCGLKVEFVSEDGHTVSSEITEIRLPSRSGNGKANSSTRGFVREARLGGKPVDAAGSPTLDSLTIPLPKQ